MPKNLRKTAKQWLIEAKGLNVAWNVTLNLFTVAEWPC